MIWQPRCTADALSGTRHIESYPLPCPMIALMMLSGGVNPIMRALSMTHAFVPVLVVFPQLSPCIRSCLLIIPNPCTLGQQVTTLLFLLLFSYASCPDLTPRVLLFDYS